MSEIKIQLCARQKGVELWSHHSAEYSVKDGQYEFRTPRWPSALRVFKYLVLKKIAKQPQVKEDNGNLSCLLEPMELKVELRQQDNNHWEVALVQWQKSKPMPGGKFIEAGFKWPSPSEWGDLGWTFTNREEAVAHFHSLIYDHLNLEKRGEWPCPGDWDRRNGPNWRWREGLKPADGVFTPSKHQSAKSAPVLPLQ